MEKGERASKREVAADGRPRACRSGRERDRRSSRNELTTYIELVAATPASVGKDCGFRQKALPHITAMSPMDFIAVAIWAATRRWRAIFNLRPVRVTETRFLFTAFYLLFTTRMFSAAGFRHHPR